MTGTFDFNMSCPCDGRLARIITDIVRQAAKDAGRDDDAAAAMAASADDFVRGCFAADYRARQQRVDQARRRRPHDVAGALTPRRMLRLYNTLSRQEEPFAPERD